MNNLSQWEWLISLADGVGAFCVFSSVAILTYISIAAYIAYEGEQALQTEAAEKIFKHLDTLIGDTLSEEEAP